MTELQGSNPSMPDSIDAGPLTLRRWDESHLSAQLSAMEQSIDELRPWMDWAASGMPSTETQRATLRDGVARFDRDTAWVYALFEAAGDEYVGGCGLHPTAPDRAEIGYWVRTDRHGRGYATGAARALTTAAFAALPRLGTIEIHVDCANVASARIPQKLGYRLVRTADQEISAPGQTGRQDTWSIARDDWRAGSDGGSGTVR